MPNPSTPLEIDQAFEMARSTPILPFDERVRLVNRLQELLIENKVALARLISEEMGKPLWDAAAEMESVIMKIPISIAAYKERCGEKQETGSFRRFKPHGTAVVLGPFNFPIHLPNGHIVPALLAGNKVIFKPSEFTPLCGEAYFKLFEQAGFPKGYLQILFGGKEVGEKLVDDIRLDALFFTGSAKTGLYLSDKFAKTPGKLLALELGGNNPLVIGSIKDIDAAVYGTLISSFQTSGQRCTCARRLIVIQNEQFIKRLVEKIPKIKVGSFDDEVEPFMGPLIHDEAVRQVLKAQDDLLNRGAKPLVKSKMIKPRHLTPGLVDVTGLSVPDEEIFGPLLQLIRVKSLEEAIEVANNTAYGLVSAIFTDDEKEWELFYQRSKSGLINKNAPTTGALSTNPFGGTGISGNHRPSGYFAADYCSYVTAGVEQPTVQKKVFPGLPHG